MGSGRFTTVPVRPGGEAGGEERYELLRQLGAGGVGVVWEAWDRELGRRVAIKLLKRMDPAGLLRFKREFRALADLAHDNLVTLFSLEQIHADESGRIWALVMELVHGRTLLRWVRGDSEGPLTDPAALDRLRDGLTQLVHGLRALHEAGVVHRDVKPSNVLVDARGRVVLLDFGLVAEVSRSAHSSGVTEDGGLVGTAAYMAPEQSDERRTGPAVDLYSVGVVLFEALTGQLPFSGEVLQILVDKRISEAPRVLEVAPGADPGLAELADALLRRDPGKRPRAEEVIARLGLEEAPATPPSVPGRPVFVGRDDELEALAHAWDEAQRGERLITVLVQGESGVGKSALVSHFLDVMRLDAKVPGVILMGRCYESESVPYKAFDGIVDALSQYLRSIDQVDCALLLPRDALLLARMFPVLQRVPALARMPTDRGSARRPHVRGRAFAALRELLRNLAEHQPLTLYIDDLQWADPDSLALLGEVLQPPEAPPLLLIATARTATGALERPLEQELATLGARVDIRLEGLPRSEAVELAQRLLGARDEHGVAESLAREGGGHPLFIAELARHQHRTRPGPTTLVRLDEALWARVNGLAPEARGLLEVLAVAGEPLAFAVATDAAELDGQHQGRLMVSLRAANLVKSSGVRATDLVEPYHDRVREAVLAHIEPERRVELHGKLADALNRAGYAGLEPQILIRHLEAAGHPLRAAQLAEDAARRAALALAYDRAADLFQTAIWLPEHSAAARQSLALQQAEALCNAGRGLEAAEVFLSLVEGAERATRLECQRRAAEQLLVSGHYERGIEVLAGVLEDIGVKLPKTPRRALMSILWQRLMLKLRGLRWVRRDESEVPASMLTRVDIHYGVAMGLSMVDNVRGVDFQQRALRLALTAGEPRRMARALGMQAMAASATGDRQRGYAKSLIERIEGFEEAGRDPWVDAWIASAKAMQAYFGFELSRALDLLIEAEGRFQELPTGSFFEAGNRRTFRLHVLSRMGRLRELRQRYDACLRDAVRRGDRLMETTLARAFNVLWLAADEPDIGLVELEHHAWTPLELGFHLQHWFGLRAKIERLLYAGEGETARAALAKEMQALEASLLLRVQSIRTEYAWCQGRLLIEEIRRGAPQGAGAAELRRWRKVLAKEDRYAYANAVGACLDAAVAPQARRAEALALAAERAREAEMALLERAAKRQLGVSLGQAELVEQADRAMAAEGVMNPARMTAMLVPVLNHPE